jgi:hypothetical protein
MSRVARRRRGSDRDVRALQGPTKEVEGPAEGRRVLSPELILGPDVVRAQEHCQEED